MPRSLDSFDRAILRILQVDNRTPQRVISERVNLSPAAVQRRIAAMEDAGIISRNVAIIAPDTLSLAITAIVEVHLRNDRRRIKRSGFVETFPAHSVTVLRLELRP